MVFSVSQIEPSDFSFLLPDNKSIMITKESKKIIRTYNKVARALIEYETLWHHAVRLNLSLSESFWNPNVCCSGASPSKLPNPASRPL